MEAIRDTQKLAFWTGAETMVLSAETITPLGLILERTHHQCSNMRFLIPLGPDDAHHIEKKKRAYWSLGIRQRQRDATIHSKSSFGIQLITLIGKKLKGTLSSSQNKPQGTITKLVFLRFSELLSSLKKVPFTKNFQQMPEMPGLHPRSIHPHEGIESIYSGRRTPHHSHRRNGAQKQGFKVLGDSDSMPRPS